MILWWTLKERVRGISCWKNIWIFSLRIFLLRQRLSMFTCIGNSRSFFILHRDIWLGYVETWMVSCQLEIFGCKLSPLTDFRVIVRVLMHANSVMSVNLVWISSWLVSLVLRFFVCFERLEFLFSLVLILVVVVLIKVLILLRRKVLIVVFILILVNELLEIFVKRVFFNYHIFLYFHTIFMIWI